MLHQQPQIADPGLATLLGQNPPQFEGQKAGWPRERSTPEEPLLFWHRPFVLEKEEPEEGSNQQHEKGEAHHAVECQVDNGGGRLEIGRESIQSFGVGVEVKVRNQTLAVWDLDGRSTLLPRLWIDDAPDIERLAIARLDHALHGRVLWPVGPAQGNAH